MRQRSDGKTKYRVLKAIAEACVNASVPPLDERLKSMVASMVGNLLRGGWPEKEIAHVAIELALKYDRFNAHVSLLGLQRVMELADENAQKDRHDAFRVVENRSMDPRVAKILGGAAKRDPRRLPGNHRAEGDPCRVCQGPPGVHVSFQNIPDLEREAMRQMEHERQKRRPMKAVGE